MSDNIDTEIPRKNEEAVDINQNGIHDKEYDKQ